MLKFLIELSEAAPLLTLLVTIVAFLWLHRDIKGIKSDMTDMKSELRGDHSSLTAKVEKMDEKLNTAIADIAQLKGAMDERNRHLPAA